MQRANFVCSIAIGSPTRRRRPANLRRSLSARRFYNIPGKAWKAEKVWDLLVDTLSRSRRRHTRRVSQAGPSDRRIAQSCRTRRKTFARPWRRLRSGTGRLTATFAKRFPKLVSVSVRAPRRTVSRVMRYSAMCIPTRSRRCSCSEH